ncbi:hypothetical protein Taro_048379 [Colocasia esculenta]|uniref:Uncharacterized protein n=1 Tax=Colocasia esculenta TaxID=4460 RepID=A0A843X7U4_COLES|nr:hypothetical protein [Colocasia esculenta]
MKPRVGDAYGDVVWVGIVSFILFVLSNRSFILDLMGRVTSEMSVKLVHREVVERGMEMVRYASVHGCFHSMPCPMLSGEFPRDCKSLKNLQVHGNDFQGHT